MPLKQCIILQSFVIINYCYYAQCFFANFYCNRNVILYITYQVTIGIYTLAAGILGGFHHSADVHTGIPCCGWQNTDIDPSSMITLCPLLFNSCLFVFCIRIRPYIVILRDQQLFSKNSFLHADLLRYLRKLIALLWSTELRAIT